MLFITELVIHVLSPIALVVLSFQADHSPLTNVMYFIIANVGLKFFVSRSESLNTITGFSLRWIVPVSVLYASLMWEEWPAEQSETVASLFLIAGLHLVFSLLFELIHAFKFYAEEGGYRFFKWLIPTFLATLVLLVIVDFLGFLRL